MSTAEEYAVTSGCRLPGERSDPEEQRPNEQLSGRRRDRRSEPGAGRALPGERISDHEGCRAARGPAVDREVDDPRRQRIREQDVLGAPRAVVSGGFLTAREFSHLSNGRVSPALLRVTTNPADAPADVGALARPRRA
jgi:hypothetical protein